jgi:hypothetical protein
MAGTSSSSQSSALRKSPPLSLSCRTQHKTSNEPSLATTTVSTALLADLTLSPVLFRIKNILTLTSTPLEVLISTLYWSLRAIDPALVLPEWAPRLATSIDFGFHVIPALSLTLDLLFFSPPWTIQALPATAVSSVIAFSYWFWIEVCYGRNGFYPYPIFAMLDTTQRVGLFAGSAALMTIITVVLREVYRVVNRGTRITEGGERKSQ